MTAIDTEQFRDVLARGTHASQAARFENLHEETSGICLRRRRRGVGYDNHLADTATETYDRELDYTLEENSEHVLGEIEAALNAHRGRHLRHLHELRQADSRGAARGAALGDAVHRLPARPGARLTERVTTRTDRHPRRFDDRRADTDLRSPSASSAQAGRSGSASARSRSPLGADQLTKSIVTSRLDLNDQVHVVGSVLDPPRHELGNRLRPASRARRRSSSS